MNRDAGNLQPGPQNLPPLCVDLDGTLVTDDTFYASVFALLQKNFFFVLLFPFWLLRGKAFVKQQVSEHVALGLDKLHFNQAVLDFLLNEYEKGRELLLATGSDRKIAEGIADHLKIFSTVMASDGVRNLTGVRKRVALEEKFGERGFDYIANAPIDIDVWRSASSAYLVTKSSQLIDEVKAVTNVAGVFQPDTVAEPATISDYISIARPDHWLKNIFILPGMLLVLYFFDVSFSGGLLIDAVVAIAATCLVASSNYVINEILDAEHDCHHPAKKVRPLAAGRISLPVAYLEWMVLGVIGMSLGFFVNSFVGGSCVFLWIMGTLYNIPPIRTKELPFLDVLSESINNPIRMAIGWYAMGVSVMPPISALFAYWMFGAFLMATKRFAEYRRIGNPELAAQYRKSFLYYNEERLIVGSVFYISLFITGAVVFIMLYRLELMFAMPFVAYLLSYYLYLGFRPDSPVQYPERLFRERQLRMAVILCSLLGILLFFVDFPAFRDFFVLLTPRS